MNSFLQSFPPALQQWIFCLFTTMCTNLRTDSLGVTKKQCDPHKMTLLLCDANMNIPSKYSTANIQTGKIGIL